MQTVHSLFKYIWITLNIFTINIFEVSETEAFWLNFQNLHHFQQFPLSTALDMSKSSLFNPQLKVIHEEWKTEWYVYQNVIICCYICKDMHQRGTRPIFFDKRPRTRLIEKLTNTPRSVVPVYPSLPPLAFLFFKKQTRLYN